MLKLAIFVLIFCSIGLLSTQILPFVTELYLRSQKKKFEKSAQKLDKMFIEVQPVGPVYFFIVLSPILLGLAGLVFVGNLLGLIAGLVLGIILPQIIIQKYDQIRRSKFQQQLIDGLLILSSSLKSGLSLLQAFELLVEEMPLPLSQEFKLLLNEIKIGIPIEEALDRLNQRMYSEELNMLVSAILVGKETGGDLSRILEQIVTCIRQKNKVTQQLTNLTLQARWQGMIMMALPVVFAFGVVQMNPKYFNIMLSSETGRGLLIYVAVSQIVGMALIKKLSRLED